MKSAFKEKEKDKSFYRIIRLWSSIVGLNYYNVTISALEVVVGEMN